MPVTVWKNQIEPIKGGAAYACCSPAFGCGVGQGCRWGGGSCVWDQRVESQAFRPWPGSPWGTNVLIRAALQSWFSTGPRASVWYHRKRPRLTVCCPRLPLHLSREGLCYSPKAPNHSDVDTIRQLWLGIWHKKIQGGAISSDSFAGCKQGCWTHTEQKACNRLLPSVFIFNLLCVRNFRSDFIYAKSIHGD